MFTTIPQAPPGVVRPQSTVSKKGGRTMPTQSKRFPPATPDDMSQSLNDPFRAPSASPHPPTQSPRPNAPQTPPPRPKPLGPNRICKSNPPPPPHVPKNPKMSRPWQRIPHPPKRPIPRHRAPNSQRAKQTQSFRAAATPPPAQLSRYRPSPNPPLAASRVINARRARSTLLIQIRDTPFVATRYNSPHL